MKKVLLVIMCCCIFGSVALAIPTAVCDGPNQVAGNSNDDASAFYHVRKSYDYHDHNLSTTSRINWSKSGNGCGATQPTISDGRDWDSIIHFNVDPDFPLYCLITIEIVDGGASTCSKNVRIAPHCETFPDEGDCISIGDGER